MSFSEVMKEESNMSNHHVVFGSTVRSIDSYIPNLIQHIERCGNKFASWKLVVYENDSTDRTRQILLDEKNRLLDQGDKIECIFEDNVSEPSRTKRLAHGRNMILDKIRAMSGPIDYVIMLDGDNINMSGTFVQTIESCFQNPTESWDVMAGNQANSHYYDIWALRYDPIIKSDCWADGGHFDINSVYFDKNLPPFEVDSAFSGIAIYKWSIMSQCQYDGEYHSDNPFGYPTGREKCEHVALHECIKKKGGTIWINPAFSTN